MSSFEYMDRVQKEMARQFPDIRTFFSSGSMVDAVLNMGMPAPIDVQVSSPDLHQIYGVAQDLASKIRSLPGVGEVYIPQDMNYPALRLDVDRVHAAELGLTPERCSGQCDHRAEFELHDRAELLGGPQERQRLLPHRPVFRKRPGRDPQHGRSRANSSTNWSRAKKNLRCGPAQLKPASFQFMHLPNQKAAWACAQAMPDPRRVHPPEIAGPTRPISVLDNVVNVEYVQTPTEVDHYQIQRVTDVYVTPLRRTWGRFRTRLPGSSRS